jgi:hypothetical protein
MDKETVRFISSSDPTNHRIDKTARLVKHMTEDRGLLVWTILSNGEPVPNEADIEVITIEQAENKYHFEPLNP